MVVLNSYRKYRELKMVEIQGIDYGYLGWKLFINFQFWGNGILKDVICKLFLIIENNS